MSSHPVVSVVDIGLENGPLFKVFSSRWLNVSSLPCFLGKLLVSSCILGSSCEECRYEEVCTPYQGKVRGESEDHGGFFLLP